MNTLTRSREVLTHFLCKACNGWWSIGDFDVQRQQYPTSHIHCPWCGMRHKLATNDD